MRYTSEWYNSENNKKELPTNLNYYFIHPIDENHTQLIAFIFLKVTSWHKFFMFALKRISSFLTKKQIVEDEEFYKKVKSIPKSFKNMNLDRFDEPLVEIRKMCSETELKKYV